MWIDGLRQASLVGALLFGMGQLGEAQEGGVTAPKTTSTVVCASEDGTEVIDGNPIIVLTISKAAEGWSVSGDFAGSEVLVKDQNRFTVVGPNYLITRYHNRGALIAVDFTIPLFCKGIPPDVPG